MLKEESPPLKTKAHVDRVGRSQPLEPLKELILCSLEPCNRYQNNSLLTVIKTTVDAMGA